MRNLSAMLAVAVLVPFQAQAAVEPQYMIVPGVSVGTIKLGMHIAEVRTLLGKEKFSSSSPDGMTHGYGFSAPGTPGLRVQTKAGLVTQVSAYLDPAYRTAENIGVGSSAAEVEQAYGIPQRQQHHKAQIGLQSVSVLYAEYDIGLFIGIRTDTNTIIYIGVKASK